MTPIYGIRYKCFVCKDYDLCESCESKSIHDHHAFIKIRSPKLAPKIFVTVDAYD